MSRISAMFQKGPAFVGYLTAGDGGIDYTIDAALALIAGGVNILELGIPFTDPIADGPVIQQAAQRALSQKITPIDVLEIARSLRRETEIPIVLMSYYNPIFCGGEELLKSAAQVGVDGVLVVDLPPEEAEKHLKMMEDVEMDPIFLASPSTPMDRIELLNGCGKGFLYYACRRGTTGVQQALPKDFIETIKGIRERSTLPVVTGFGVGDHQSAQDVLQHCDGCVVGSAIVAKIAEKIEPSALTQFIESIDPRHVMKGERSCTSF